MMYFTNPNDPKDIVIWNKRKKNDVIALKMLDYYRKRRKGSIISSLKDTKTYNR